MFDNQTIILALGYLQRFIYLLILIRVLFSWINPNPHNPWTQLIYTLTEPILAPVRTLIYKVLKYNGMIDFSPILALFLIRFIHDFIVRLLY